MLGCASETDRKQEPVFTVCTALDETAGQARRSRSIAVRLNLNVECEQDLQEEEGSDPDQNPDHF